MSSCGYFILTIKIGYDEMQCVSANRPRLLVSCELYDAIVTIYNDCEYGIICPQIGKTCRCNSILEMLWAKRMRFMESIKKVATTSYIQRKNVVQNEERGLEVFNTHGS